MIKPFKVDFQFLYPSEASMYVCAETADQAAQGAAMILGEDYTGLKVTAVTPVDKEQEKKEMMN